jgi:hypothetical protein
MTRKLIFAKGRRVLARAKKHPDEGFAIVTKDHYSDDTFVAVRFEDNGVGTTYGHAKPISQPSDMQEAQFVDELAELANEDSISGHGAELIRDAVRRLQEGR